MSPDFWAGYLSGAVSIMLGNPLDLIKVRLQNSAHVGAIPLQTVSQFPTIGTLIRGTAAPVLTNGAVGSILYMSYNRVTDLMNAGNPSRPSLWMTFLAGAIAALPTWVVNTPTELIKCRTQLSSPPASSFEVTKDIIRTSGIRGLYFGGAVTVLRDSIGYGFYFWTYELSTRFMTSEVKMGNVSEAAKVLLCGGLAGVVSWGSIFPLDVIKTRVQAQVMGGENTPLILDGEVTQKKLGTVEIARMAYRTHGMRVFFRGIAVCSLRAFIANAAQWGTYELIMRELAPKQKLTY